MGFARNKLIICGWLAASLVCCACSSDDKVAGGNSSEVGSPELVGRLAYSGKPAALAKVYCIPEGYEAGKSSSGELRFVMTNGDGEFAFEGLEAGSYNVEAYVDSLGVAFRKTGISIVADSLLELDAELQKVGALSVDVNGLKDKSTVLAVVRGSAYSDSAEVVDGKILLEGFASGGYDLLNVMSGKDSVVVDSFEIKAGDTTFVSVAPNDSFEVSLNTSADGIDLADTLFGFPLLVRTETHLANDALSDWNVFYEPGHRELGFSAIQDSDGARFWVRLDTLLPQNDGQHLLFVKGENRKMSVMPFDSTDGFVAAWHFDGDSLLLVDATGRGFNGTSVGVNLEKGVAGLAYAFDGKTSSVTIDGSADSPFALGEKPLSISFWTLPSKPAENVQVWGKGYNEYFFKYQSEGRRMLMAYESGATAGWYEYVVSFSEDKPAWEHFLVEVLKDSVAIYRNGKLLESVKGFNSTDESAGTPGNFVIGAGAIPDGSSDMNYSGSIDEMFVSEKALGTEWARLLYLNQKPEGYWPL